MAILSELLKRLVTLEFLGKWEPVRVVSLFRTLSTLTIPIVVWWKVTLVEPNSAFIPILALLGLIIFFIGTIQRLGAVWERTVLPSRIVARISQVAQKEEALKSSIATEEYLKNECRGFLVPALLGSSIYELTTATIFRKYGGPNDSSRFFLSSLLGELGSLYVSYSLVAFLLLFGFGVQSFQFLSYLSPQLFQLVYLLDELVRSWALWFVVVVGLEFVYVGGGWLVVRDAMKMPKMAWFRLGLSVLYSVWAVPALVLGRIFTALYGWFYRDSRFSETRNLPQSQLKELLEKVVQDTGTGKKFSFVEYRPNDDSDYRENLKDFLKQYTVTFSGLEPRQVSAEMVKEFLDVNELKRRMSISDPAFYIGVVDGRCVFLVWAGYDFYRKVRRTWFYVDSGEVGRHLKLRLKSIEQG